VIEFGEACGHLFFEVLRLFGGKLQLNHGLDSSYLRANLASGALTSSIRPVYGA
jgi:hypothetical protein